MAAAAKQRRKKKHFTIAEANNMLPLVRSIVQDITELAKSLRERKERLQRAQQGDASLGTAYHEELEHMQDEFEQERSKMQEFEQELAALGIELKDYFIGLIDFPAMHEGREIYLCWKLGEADVAHWHELDAGFSGRQKLLAVAGKS